MKDDREEIVGIFDYPYMESRLKRVAEHNWMGRFVDSVEVKNLENLLNVKGRQFISFSNHKSHFDYLALGFLFLQHLGVREFPRFATGTNLDSPILKLMGLNFRRTGAFFIDREKLRKLRERSRDKFAEFGEIIERYFIQSLREKHSAGVFVEGGRNFFGEPMDKVQTGLVGCVPKAGVDIFILNNAIYYDQVIEEKYAVMLDCSKKTTLTRGVYYASDLAAFASRFFFREGRGNMYINFGEPKRLYDIVDSSASVGRQKIQLVKYIKTEIPKLYSEIKK